MPALDNQLTVEPSPFLEKIKKAPLTTENLVGAAPVGINGGFGFGAEGADTPNAGAMNDVRYTLQSKDLYVDVQISHKTITLGQSNKSVIINAVEQEIDSSYQSAKWNIGRSLFGDGTGVLAHLAAAAAVGDDTIYVDTADFLIEGLMIDLFASSSATSPADTLRVKAVSRVPDTNGYYEVVLNGDIGTALSAGGFVTVQSSYNRELTGLGAIYDSSIATLYGLSKADHRHLVPTSVSANHDLTDIVLYDAVKNARRYKNAKIDLIMMGDEAFAAYQRYMIESNVSVVRDRQFVGGTSGITVLVGDQMVDIVNEHFVPSTKAWGVDTTAFTYFSTPWDFASYNGSSAFVLIPHTSIYRALLASYGELMCKNPGGCIEITDCDDQ